jgi:hypothetical protein
MEARLEFAARWLLGTLLGWVLAWGFVYVVFITGGFLICILPFIFPLCVGLAQWRMALRPLMPFDKWAGSTALSGVVFIVGVFLLVPIMAAFNAVVGYAEWLSDSVNRAVGVSLFGLLLGVSFGLPQWYVLRDYSSRAAWWVLDNIFGWAASGLVVPLLYGVLNNSNVFALLLLLAFVPVMFALITGLTLYGIVTRKPKPKRDEFRIENNEL